MILRAVLRVLVFHLADAGIGNSAFPLLAQVSGFSHAAPGFQPVFGGSAPSNLGIFHAGK
jgi:hypothetical protein